MRSYIIVAAQIGTSYCRSNSTAATMIVSVSDVTFHYLPSIAIVFVGLSCVIAVETTSSNNTSTTFASYSSSVIDISISLIVMSMSRASLSSSLSIISTFQLSRL